MQRLQHQDDTKRLTGEITTLKGELAMCHQKLRLLGKRPAPADSEEVEYLKEAVCRDIKRRRTQTTSYEAPVTLQERRSTDHANTTDVVKEY